MTSSRRSGKDRVDDLIDPGHRLMRAMVFVLAAAAVAALVAGGVVAIKKVVASRHYPIESYVTADPSEPPAKESDEFSLLGIRYGIRVEEVAAMFPPDAHQTTDPEPVAANVTTDRWQWSGLLISVESKSAAVMTVRVDVDRDPGASKSMVFASLPKGLLLGTSTVADLVKAAGQPEEGSAVTEGTTAPFYLLQYLYGADANAAVTYQAIAGHAARVPFADGEIDASVCSERITGVALDIKRLGGAPWPSRGLCSS